MTKRPTLSLSEYIKQKFQQRESHDILEKFSLCIIETRTTGHVKATDVDAFPLFLSQLQRQSY